MTIALLASAAPPGAHDHAHDHVVAPFGLYGVLAIVALLTSAWVWGRLTKRPDGHDPRLTFIYFAGLIGAILGAKLAFLLAEGWAYRDNWLALLSGRSVTGALLGGYAAVEWAKRRAGYTKTTGDVFAIIVPLSLVFGRIGCLLQGCCPGVVCETEAWWTWPGLDGEPRWPAAWVELFFNLALFAWAVVASRRNWLPGNRFHVFLIAYGVFRFAHEFLRDDSRWYGEFGGYHVIALGLAAFGAWRFAVRQREAVRSS